jgi:tetratricopeptide (TPR) repeat protein
VSYRKNKLKNLIGAGLVALLVAQPAHAQDLTNADQFHIYYPSTSGSFLAGRSALLDRRTEKAASFFVDALSEDWDNVVLLDRAFMSLLASGQIEEAESIAKRLVELEPNNEVARLVQGIVALKERRYRSVQMALADMSRSTLFGITSNVVLAWAEIGLGNKEKGYGLINAIEQPGFKSFLVFQHALMADVAGDRDKARALYAEAHEADPYVVSIVEAYARFLTNVGDFDAAQAVLDQFFNRGLTHQNIEIVAEYVATQKRAGKMVDNVQQGASELLRGLSAALSRDETSDVSLVLMRLASYANPKSELIAFSLAELLEQAERYDAANQIYATLDKRSSYYESSLIRTAENLRELDQAEEAIKRLNNIVAQNPQNILALVALGDTLRTQKLYEEAAEAYSKALEITKGERPVDWHVYFVRGIAYERAKQWFKAEPDFQAALKLYPEQPQVLNYLGYSWVDQGINLNEALQMIETAVSLRPNDGAIVDSLGWAYYRLERYEDAVEVLERASRLEPSDPTINDHLGDAYWQVGRKREAQFQWLKARDMEPEEELLEKINQKLNNGLDETQNVAQAD